MPQLRVIDAKNVTGTDVRVFVEETLQGSTRQFFAPIPTEMTALASTVPVDLAVRVNNIPSACASPRGAAGCTFTYSAALTPSITAVSPAAYIFPSTAGFTTLTMNISGAGFNSSIAGVSLLRLRSWSDSNVYPQEHPTTLSIILTTLLNPQTLSFTLAGNAVSLDDDTQCAVTFASAGLITCQLPNTGAGGARLVRVRVAGKGFAGSANTAVVTVSVRVLAVTGVSPAVVSATAGATVLNVTGRGFDDVVCDRNRVSVGAAACGVLTCAYDQLQVSCLGSSSSRNGRPVRATRSRLPKSRWALHGSLPLAQAVGGLTYAHFTRAPLAFTSSGAVRHAGRGRRCARLAHARACWRACL